MRAVEEGWFVKGKWVSNPEYERLCNERHRYDGVPTALIPIGGSLAQGGGK